MHISDIFYVPITDKSLIYHRSGWKLVINALEEIFPRDSSHGAQIRLIDLLDDYYSNPKNRMVNRPWIGFIHGVPASTPTSTSALLPSPIHVDEGSMDPAHGSKPHRNKRQKASGLTNREVAPRFNNTPSIASTRGASIMNRDRGRNKDMGICKGNVARLDSLLSDKRFQRDLFYCRGLIVFSRYLEDYLKKFLATGIYRPPVTSLKHPTELDIPQFDLYDFMNNNQKRLIFIGNQERRFDRFCQITSPYPKLWLSGYPIETSQTMLSERLDESQLERWKNIEIARVNDADYDQLLTRNLVVVDLVNSSVNNTVLECIA